MDFNEHDWCANVERLSARRCFVIWLSLAVFAWTFLFGVAIIFL